MGTEYIKEIINKEPEIIDLNCIRGFEQKVFYVNIKLNILKITRSQLSPSVKCLSTMWKNTSQIEEVKMIKERRL